MAPDAIQLTPLLCLERTYEVDAVGMRFMPRKDFELVDDHFLSRLVGDGDDLDGDSLFRLLFSGQADAARSPAPQLPGHVKLLLQFRDLSHFAQRAQQVDRLFLGDFPLRARGTPQGCCSVCG